MQDDRGATALFVCVLQFLAVELSTCPPVPLEQPALLQLCQQLKAHHLHRYPAVGGGLPSVCVCVCCGFSARDVSICLGFCETVRYRSAICDFQEFLLLCTNPYAQFSGKLVRKSLASAKAIFATSSETWPWGTALVLV